MFVATKPFPRLETCQAQHMGLGPCSESVGALGYACDPHWEAAMKATALPPRVHQQDIPGADCGEPSVARGLCGPCYSWRRTRGEFRR